MDIDRAINSYLQPMRMKPLLQALETTTVEILLCDLYRFAKTQQDSSIKLKGNIKHDVASFRFNTLNLASEAGYHLINIDNSRPDIARKFGMLLSNGNAEYATIEIDIFKLFIRDLLVRMVSSFVKQTVFELSAEDETILLDYIHWIGMVNKV